MANDGFSLDDKRQPLSENDIPDLIKCWQTVIYPVPLDTPNSLEKLMAEASPLKVKRLKLKAELNRVSFEHAISTDGDEDASKYWREYKRLYRKLKTTFYPYRSK